jgi:hypothetical protein
MLKRCGFLSNVSRGKWKVNQHIPDWFSLHHAQVVIGWVGTNEDRRLILNQMANGEDRIAQAAASSPTVMEAFNTFLMDIEDFKSVEVSTKKKKSAKMSASYNKLYEKLDNIHHNMVTINSNLRELIEIYK